MHLSRRFSTKSHCVHDSAHIVHFLLHRQVGALVGCQGDVRASEPSSGCLIYMMYPWLCTGHALHARDREGHFKQACCLPKITGAKGNDCAILCTRVPAEASRHGLPALRERKGLEWTYWTTSYQQDLCRACVPYVNLQPNPDVLNWSCGPGWRMEVLPIHLERG